MKNNWVLIFLVLVLVLAPSTAHAGDSGITPVTNVHTDGAMANLDSTGQGFVVYPEMEAVSREICLPGYLCAGGNLTYNGEIYTIVTYEDGSGWLTIGDSSTTFCFIGWPCDEPPLPPVCTTDWCGSMYLPLIADNQLQE